LGIIILDTVNTDAQVCASAEEDKNLGEFVLGVLKKLLRCKPYGHTESNQNLTPPRNARVVLRAALLKRARQFKKLAGVYSISRRLFKHEITMDERKGSAAGHPERGPLDVPWEPLQEQQRANNHVLRILTSKWPFGSLSDWPTLDQGFRVGDRFCEPTDRQSLCGEVLWWPGSARSTFLLCFPRAAAGSRGHALIDIAPVSRPSRIGPWLPCVSDLPNSTNSLSQIDFARKSRITGISESGATW